MKKILLSLSLLTFLLVLSFSLWLQQQWAKPLVMSTSGPMLLELNKGQSLSHAIYQLARRAELKFPRYFVLYARLQNKTEVYAGEYMLPLGSSAFSALALFNSGEVRQYKVTFVEGLTVKDALQTLNKAEKITHTISDSESLAVLLGLDKNKLEGWLFPDTYQYSAGTSDKTILLQAYQKMQQVLEQEWAARAEGLPYKNAYEALVMASIIEKETGQASERPEIAGVFVRRLQKNMRLETDPTVIYGMGDRYKGNIRRSDLRRPTPYNTYTMKGLPPTPIALAGREAVYAALHPVAGSALFFVAKGNGRHAFSATLAEHNKAVRAYQLKRRADYNSAPQ